VTLLDVRLKPSAVRDLLTDNNPFQGMLADVPDEDIWSEKIGDKDFAGADELYARLCALPGVKRTRATKLMARKRPRFVPIVDSVILSGLGLSRSWEFQYWADALRDDRRRQRIEDLRPEGVEVSVLRLVDVLVWMHCSRGRDARALRDVD
jgi:uncharacterized protein DUF6308